MMGIEWMKPGIIVGSIMFALIGVAIFWICFVIVDKLTPYDLWGEIVEKKNVGARDRGRRDVHRDRDDRRGGRARMTHGRVAGSASAAAARPHVIR